MGTLAVCVPLFSCVLDAPILTLFCKIVKKKKPKTNKKPPPSRVTVQKCSCMTSPAYLGIRVGSTGEACRQPPQLPGCGRAFAPSYPLCGESFCIFFRPNFQDQKNIFLCFEAFTGEITQPVDCKAFLSSA